MNWSELSWNFSKVTFLWS